MKADRDFCVVDARLDGAATGIAAGEAPAGGFGAAERVAALEDELETERSVNAQLADRIERLKERHDATVARMAAETAEARALLAEAESEMRQLRAVNDRLRAASSGLREACAAGAVDAPKIDEAMRSEIEALCAARAADRRELDALIGELAPLVEREGA